MILGVDPGIADCGWALIDSQKRLIDSGCLKTSKTKPLPQRLAKIYSQIQTLCQKHQVKQMAVEAIFFAKNAKTAIMVAQATGAIKAAAAGLKVKVFEYTPLQVKIALTGYGRAEKNQVIQMVQRELKSQKKIKNNHAADAAATALTYLLTARYD